MDEGLFAKHLHTILVRNDAKQQISNSLYKKIGVSLEETEFYLSKKTVTLSVSSAKKATLLKRGLREVLTDLGYSLSV